MAIDLGLELDDVVLVFRDFGLNGCSVSDFRKWNVVLIVLLGSGRRASEALRASCRDCGVPVPRPGSIGFEEVEMVSKVMEVQRLACIYIISSETVRKLN